MTDEQKEAYEAGRQARRRIDELHPGEWERNLIPRAVIRRMTNWPGWGQLLRAGVETVEIAHGMKPVPADDSSLDAVRPEDSSLDAVRPEDRFFARGFLDEHNKIAREQAALN
jgi:hypothetical protein